METEYTESLNAKRVKQRIALEGYPTVYWKYHSDNGFLNALLLKAEFWASNYTKLNDPDDCKILFNRVLAQKFIKEHHPEIRREDMRKYSTDKKFIAEWTAHLRKNTSVCCFTRNGANDDYMWREYAKSSGVCLEFDFSGHMEILGALLPVDYKRGFNTVENKWNWSSALTSKTLKWENENEWRIIGTEEGRIPFPKESLKRIYCSPSMSDIRVAAIQSIILNEGYNCTSIIRF